MFDKILQRFIERGPVAVMVKGVLERILSAEALDGLFERVSDKQYTRTILFSTVFKLMNRVVSKTYPSVNAAYQDNETEVGTSITAVYDKINGLEITTSAALVRETAKEMAKLVYDLKGERKSWLKGYQLRVLDGNCIEATHHRLEVLRRTRAGALPGKSLVVYDPALEMAIDVIPCEDGHAQERALLGEVLAKVCWKDLWMMDRNFCVNHFLCTIDDRKGSFICRQHQGLPFETKGRERRIGQSETGLVYEQKIEVTDVEGQTHLFRRIRIVLKKDTRDGDKELFILTNLAASTATAIKVARLYRRRWTIETAFQELESYLHSEINSLGYPKAALFGFCVALVSYNVYAVVKAALRRVHGEQKIDDELSGYYLAGHLERTYEGMMIAVAEKQWEIFAQLTPARFIATLLTIARKVQLRRFRKHKRGPKNNPPKRNQYPNKNHVSTAKLLLS